MEQKIFKIKTATYNTVWMYIAELMVVGTVMFSIVSINNPVTRAFVIIITTIVAAAVYFGDYYNRIHGQILMIDNEVFKLQSTNGKIKWQVPINNISRIDAEPYILNYRLFIRAFTYTTSDGKNQFINLLPYDYAGMVNELKSLNPHLEIRTEPKARI